METKKKIGGKKTPVTKIEVLPEIAKVFVLCGMNTPLFLIFFVFLHVFFSSLVLFVLIYVKYRPKLGCLKCIQFGSEFTFRTRRKGCKHFCYKKE